MTSPAMAKFWRSRAVAEPLAEEVRIISQDCIQSVSSLIKIQKNTTPTKTTPIPPKESQNKAQPIWYRNPNGWMSTRRRSSDRWKPYRPLRTHKANQEISRKKKKAIGGHNPKQIRVPTHVENSTSDAMDIDDSHPPKPADEPTPSPQTLQCHTRKQRRPKSAAKPKRAASTHNPRKQPEANMTKIRN